jgi:hypothetical protein
MLQLFTQPNSVYVHRDTNMYILSHSLGEKWHNTVKWPSQAQIEQLYEKEEGRKHQSGKKKINHLFT